MKPKWQDIRNASYHPTDEEMSTEDWHALFNELYDHAERLQAVVDEQATVCAFCGKWFDTAKTTDEIEAHIFECEKHPMHSLIQHIDAREPAVEALKQLTREKRKLEQLEALDGVTLLEAQTLLEVTRDVVSKNPCPCCGWVARHSKACPIARIKANWPHLLEVPDEASA